MLIEMSHMDMEVLAGSSAGEMRTFGVDSDSSRRSYPDVF